MITLTLIQTFLVFFSLVNAEESVLEDLKSASQFTGDVNRLMLGPTHQHCVDCTEERDMLGTRHRLGYTATIKPNKRFDLVVKSIKRCERPANELFAVPTCRNLAVTTGLACTIEMDLSTKVPRGVNVKLPGLRQGYSEISRKGIDFNRLSFADFSAKGKIPMSLTARTGFSRELSGVNFRYDDKSIDRVSVDLRIKDKGKMRTWDRVECTER